MQKKKGISKGLSAMVRMFRAPLEQNIVAFGSPLKLFHYPETRKWADTVFAIDPLTGHRNIEPVFDKKGFVKFFESRIIQVKDSLLIFYFGCPVTVSEVTTKTLDDDV